MLADGSAVKNSKIGLWWVGGCSFALGPDVLSVVLGWWGCLGWVVRWWFGRLGRGLRGSGGPIFELFILQSDGFDLLAS